MGMDIAMRNVYEKPVGVKYEGKVKQQYINYRGRCEAWHHEHRGYLDYENSQNFTSIYLVIIVLAF